MNNQNDTNSVPKKKFYVSSGNFQNLRLAKTPLEAAIAAFCGVQNEMVKAMSEGHTIFISPLTRVSEVGFGLDEEFVCPTDSVATTEIDTKILLQEAGVGHLFF